MRFVGYYVLWSYAVLRRPMADCAFVIGGMAFDSAHVIIPTTPKHLKYMSTAMGQSDPGSQTASCGPQPDFARAHAYALARLERELSPALCYHSVAHTRDDVVVAAERLAALEGVDGEALLL